MVALIAPFRRQLFHTRDFDCWKELLIYLLRKIFADIFYLAPKSSDEAIAKGIRWLTNGPNKRKHSSCGESTARGMMMKRIAAMILMSTLTVPAEARVGHSGGHSSSHVSSSRSSSGEHWTSGHITRTGT